MLLGRRFKIKCLTCASLVVGALSGTIAELPAGEVRLKNGFILEGKLVPIQGLSQAVIRQAAGPIKTHPILMVYTGVQRYFVPKRKVEELSRAAELARSVIFKLPQKKISGKRMVHWLGRLSDVSEFDKYGRRRVTLTTPKKPVHVIQGITAIRPKYLTVTGLSHLWEYGLATTSIPAETLDGMIRNATDQTNPDDRMSIARFYLQAGFYPRSAAELDSIVRDFPELKARVQQVTLELRQLQAKQLLGELRRRRRAGQHTLAHESAKRFPLKRMSVDVQRDVREFLAEYDDSRERVEKARLLLGELQAQLKNSKQVSEAAPLRSTVTNRLDYESLERLDAFLNLVNDESLSSAEKLALAYSGWVLGGANAITDFDATLRIWNARFLIGEYLRAGNPDERENLLGELESLEGIGPNRIIQLISQLPMPLETPSIRPGEAQTIEVPGSDPERPLKYAVLLPLEYSPHHRYPMIVSLRPAERTTASMLNWWGGTAEKPGQAQRHGYIVIAPEYADKKMRRYDYDVEVHHAVLRSIRDARKRFNVDSDRIFLSGHGMGGDVAFDIGMSHPDLFAGVIPITGFCDVYGKWYWRNAKHLPWYVVAGELDRNTTERNASVLNRMMRYGYDVIYAEYVGRGYESYYAEIHRLFDWMDLHRRVKYVKEVNARVLRPSDNRFYWLQGEGFPRKVLQADVLSGQRGVRISPMPFRADITPTNTVRITRSGVKRHTIWLSPELIDFERRVVVKIRGRKKFNKFISPQIKTILEDLRTRGDRQKLYQVKLVID